MHKGTSYEALRTGKRTNCIFRCMPIGNIQRYYKAPLENRAIFSKGRIGNPTGEGYQVTCSPGLTPVGLMRHRKKTNTLGAKALNRKGKAWRR